MGDEVNNMFTWVCPHCGQTYEETDPCQLEVRILTHKCSPEIRQDKEVAKCVNHAKKLTTARRMNCC